MNDSEMFDRLRRIDPLLEGIHITPANDAVAVTLMESVMANDVLDPSGDHVTTAGATIEAPLTARRWRRRWYTLAGAGAVAAVAAVIVLPGPERSSAALAWTPVPRIATDADAATARQACTIPEITEPQSVDTGPRSDDTATPTSPTRAPVTLGPLAALDQRGEGGLAVFTGDEGVVLCMLRIVDGAPQYAGMIAGVLPQPTDTLTVDAGMTTGVDTELAVSMLTGQAGSAARVELEVPDLDPVTATLVDGRFAAWWPEASGASSLDAPITVRAFAADGTEVAEIEWTAGRGVSDASRAATP